MGVYFSVIIWFYATEIATFGHVRYSYKYNRLHNVSNGNASNGNASNGNGSTKRSGAFYSGIFPSMPHGQGAAEAVIHEEYWENGNGKDVRVSYSWS